jgi:hypothetical protein
MLCNVVNTNISKDCGTSVFRIKHSKKSCLCLEVSVTFYLQINMEFTQKT